MQKLCHRYSGVVFELSEEQLVWPPVDKNRFLSLSHSQLKSAEIQIASYPITFHAKGLFVLDNQTLLSVNIIFSITKC